MLLGTTGAVAGGLLGMLIWFLIIKWTNSEWGIIAWGVGGLVGFGCRTLGQGYSRKLGLIAGACATIAILGGEYLGTKAAFDGFMDTFQSTLYEAQLDHAKKAAKVSSDAEIRALLAGEEADQAAKDAVTTAQIERFKKELPKLKDLASGRTTKEQFLKEIRDRVDESSEARGLVLKNSFSLWTLLWLFLGVGTAWRLGSGETE